MRIRSAEEVLDQMKGNRLRSFPNRKNGRDRLFPFARPRMTDATANGPTHPTVFVAGSCLARQLEKAVTAAGLDLTFRRDLIGFGHSDEEKKQNFNRYNLGVLENELRWALDPTADAGCHSLIENNGELVDMQLVWTFAHDAQTARAMRRAYNADFATIRDADLIVLTLGAADMWYDRQTGAYLNGLVPQQFANAHPGRFELHVWDIEDFIAAFSRIRELIHTHSTRPNGPRLAICVSPVAQPLVFSPDDALIAETFGKSKQRVAAQLFAEQHDDVDYAPVYEFVVLTDRDYAYQSNTFNHVQPECVDRFFGDYLRAIGADPGAASAISARGEAMGLLNAGAPEKASEVLEKHIAEFGQNNWIGQLHAQVLSQSGRAQEAASAYLDHATSGSEGSWKSMQSAFRAAISQLDRETAERVLLTAQGYLQQAGGGTPRQLAVLTEWQAALVAVQQKLDQRQQLQDLKRLVGTNPRQAAEALAARKAQGFNDAQEHWLYAQALRKSGDPLALSEFDQIARSKSNYAKAANRVMIQILSRKNADAQGFDLAEIQSREKQLSGAE